MKIIRFDPFVNSFSSLGDRFRYSFTRVYFDCSCWKEKQVSYTGTNNSWISTSWSSGRRTSICVW